MMRVFVAKIETISEMDVPPPYLLSSYDPSKATVIELISVLSEYNVMLPKSRQRKQVYVQLFTEHLQPRQTELLREWKRTHANKVSNEENKSKSTKKSKASFIQEKTRSPEQQPITSASVKQNKQNEDQENMNKSSSESFFSPKNPFQQQQVSLKSPSAIRQPNQALGGPVESPSFNSPLRKNNKGPKSATSTEKLEKITRTPKTITGWTVPDSSTPYVDHSSPLANRMSVSPGKMSSLTGSPARPYLERHFESKKWTSHLFSSFLIFLMAFAGFWYLQASKDFVFCSKGQTVFDMNSPFPKRFVPQCFVCPAHAICSKKAVTACDSPQFALQPSLFSKVIPLNYLPFPFNQKTCVDASDMLAKEAQILQKLASVIDDIVIRWIGKAECGEVPFVKDYEWAWSSSIPQNHVLGMPVSLAKTELRLYLSKNKKKIWNDQAFDDLWSKFLEALVPSPDPEKQVAIKNLWFILDDTHHQYRLLKSASAPIKSFQCQLRVSVHSLAQRYSIELTMIGFFIAFFTILYTRRQNAKKEAIVLSRLVDDILDAIQGETEVHLKDKMRHPLPGLSVSQLRDHFLPVYSARHRALKPLDPETGFPCELDVNGRLRWFLDDSTRARIWSKAYSTLISNANIKEIAMEVNGEGHGVLMFIGSHSLGVVSPRKELSVSGF